MALFRGAVWPQGRAPASWPDPTDSTASRVWLREVWADREFASAVGFASPSLAARIEAICAGGEKDDKRLRRAVVATGAYLLRAVGRPTPFGLFAGVAPISIGEPAQVRWGRAHRPVARVDTQWLANVVDRLEADPDLLQRLDVVINNLATRHGDRLEAPCAVGRIQVRHTAAVQAVREAAATPIPFSTLVDKLAEAFGVTRSTVAGLVTELVRQGFLLTSVRAPLTVTDPLAYLLDRINGTGSAEPVLDELRAVRAEVLQLDRSRVRALAAAPVVRRMRQIAPSVRVPLAVDVLLDCAVRLPEHVAEEVAAAASVLLRLTRHPAGRPAWRDYHAAFCERYGIGTLVPVTEVVDVDAGLGYPAGYPGSVLPAPADQPSSRDRRLRELAWRAVIEGRREIVLSDETIRWIAGDEALDPARIPPHVELAARIRASSVAALSSGDYRVTVAPARAGGTLTSRFTATMTGSGLETVYRDLPVTTEGALPVQLSFPPAYPHAENVTRVPAYLRHVVPLGEHRAAGDEEATIALEDLAVTATHDRLYLVSRSRRQVVEPQVFHALDLTKQAPPLARFLAELPRAYTATWTVLDWGPQADTMPYLPAVSYRRSILTPARWRLTTHDLSGTRTDHAWQAALNSWLTGLGCPTTVELHDDDRTLPLNLAEPLHATILRAHLTRHGHAILTEPAPVATFGWIYGHAHEIVLPMVRTGALTPGPVVAAMPTLDNATHGQWPGDQGARWLSVRIHTSPERQDEIIAHRLPDLADRLGARNACWFIRYRTSQQSDHIRLRVAVPNLAQSSARLELVADWSRGLRRDGLASGLIFDSYQPEIGRYGVGPALSAAEAVFVADSQVVSNGLRHLAAAVDRTVLTTAGMVRLACGFLGTEHGMRWLAGRAVGAVHPPVDRTTAGQAVRLARPGGIAELPGWTGELTAACQTVVDALARYRAVLPTNANTDTVLESLLHLHHNRIAGIEPSRERVCRRLASQAARAWLARRAGDNG